MKVGNRLGSLLVSITIILSISIIIPEVVDSDGDGVLNTYYTWEGYGGYAANGTGTWGSNSGNISLQGIPIGAVVVAAFIYWVCPSTYGLDTFIYVNNIGVTGTQIGNDGIQYGYRSDITPIVTGNGIYNITDITYIYGLTIVAVYLGPDSPYVSVMINDGMDTNYGQPLPHWLTVTEFSRFNASSNPRAYVTYIMGDGQFFDPSGFPYDKYSFNGNIIAFNEADGSDGNGDTHGWDTDTYNVSAYLSQGDTTATANMYEDNDELMWVACILSVTSTPPGNNLPPVAEAGMDMVVFEGDILYFDGSNSYDPDGTVVIYEWDFDLSDGLAWEAGGVPDATDQAPIHTFNESSIYIVTLRVGDNNGSSDIDMCNVTVLELPVLYINMSDDGRDAVLSWNESSLPGMDYYLLYRSTSQTDFNFTDIWVNTSTDYELGESGPAQLRTMWNDTNSAVPGDFNYEKEYYYILRAVNIQGGYSRTSRTVGKWTRIFPPGISSFSLPLEPLVSHDTEWYINDMNAEYLKFMNKTTHTWNQPGIGGPDSDNPHLRLGEGYEVKLTNQTNYSFIGFPGSMIAHDSDTGFTGFNYLTEANTLLLTVGPGGDVNLVWQEPACMKAGDWYEIYHSISRDGFFGTLGVDYHLNNAISYGNNSTIHIDAQADAPDSRIYYMIIPFNSSGVKGAGSYSIGVWTEEYLCGYDTFGIPLKPCDYRNVDWYCDNIPNTTGINYYNTSSQRWMWHSARMDEGAYDPAMVISEGYQVSTAGMTSFTFTGR